MGDATCLYLFLPNQNISWVDFDPKNSESSVLKQYVLYCMYIQYMYYNSNASVKAEYATVTAARSKRLGCHAKLGL